HHHCLYSWLKRRSMRSTRSLTPSTTVGLSCTSSTGKAMAPRSSLGNHWTTATPRTWCSSSTLPTPTKTFHPLGG
ncbi:UNVERIFIED_CONTAM: hypothetical protein K2H54_013709, partial [Gekko kuhli]